MTLRESGARDLRGATILAVDDEESNLQLLREFLADDGFPDIATERDPLCAEEAWEAVRPDLLLLDLHMAPLDGFGVMERVRARVPDGEYFPILVLTADATPATRLRALAGGASDFLAKPLDAVEVVLRIRNLLRTRALYLREREARRRAAFLAEASRVLSLSFDTRSMLGTVARLAVREVADCCVVELAGADGAVERVALAHADREREARLERAEGLLGGAVPARHPLARQLAAGQFLLAADLPAALGGPAAAEGPEGEALRALLPRSLASVPLLASGRVLGWVSLATAGSGRVLDADDLALAEELARRIAAALETAQLYHDALQATRARDEVLGVVAHDLRNPLGTIRMGAQLLQGEVQEPQRRPVETVLRAAARMDALIGDLLEVTRIESGGLALERRPESVRALLLEAAAMLGPLAEARSLELECRPHPGLPPVEMDAARVLQVLSNLVGNAIKFTPAGGRITVACEPDGGGVRFAVSDTGPGIPPDQLPHVFGRFWQAGRADRRGVGLGLSIARGIVEAHGGRIWAESVEGAGSTFHFTLPGSAAAPPDPAAGEADAAAVSALPAETR